ncbi:hypothetical protein quinque_013950 [Culex quinquefasciatus]
MLEKKLKADQKQYNRLLALQLYSERIKMQAVEILKLKQLRLQADARRVAVKDYLRNSHDNRFCGDRNLCGDDRGEAYEAGLTCC